MKRYFLNCFLIFLFLGKINQSLAWVYPEHRDITLLAIRNLSPDHRTQLNRMWTITRQGYENRLTETVIDTLLGTKPSQLDYASWSAIAGDHSCSPENLLYNVLQAQWILEVAGIAAQLKLDIARSDSKSQHINALRNSDISLQRADDDYATRAGSNNVHFLLARPALNTTLAAYLTACFKEGTELNALGMYAWYHSGALLKAARYAKEKTGSGERADLLMAAMADEAFALHFLEDVYASGHIAGTWGNTSQRKGTHDYYNEHGLEVVSWEGNRSIQMGDAYMGDADAALAAVAVRMSLEQLLEAASGNIILKTDGSLAIAFNRADSFNVCNSKLMMHREYDLPLLTAILIKTPVPALATGLGELPRFRAEVGKFWGISAAFNGSVLFGGFGKDQTQVGTQGGLEGNIRFGLGLDGVLNQSGDGLVFLQLGWRQDAASSNKFVNTDAAISTNSITSAIPGRAGYNIRVRVPFYLLPGDLLLAGPILLFTSKKTLQEMAVTAANGGLIPWQSGIATGIGRFQVVLGREVGVSFYGRNSTRDAIIIPRNNGSSYLLQYQSTKLDFPILEYRPLRNFSQNQSASLMLQVNGGVDIPHHAKVLLPEGDVVPGLKKTWYLGVRILFNWRHYYSTK